MNWGIGTFWEGRFGSGWHGNGLLSLHDAFVAYLDQTDSDEYPEQFPHTGVEAGEDAYARGTEPQYADYQRQATFAGSKLHGEEEEDVAYQRREGQDEYGIEEGEADSQLQEYEVILKGVDHSGHVFPQQG